MDREALARLAGDDRVPHGSSDDPGVLDFSANTNPVVPDGVEAVYEEAVGTSEVGELPDPDAFRSAAAVRTGSDIRERATFRSAT